MHRTAIVMLSYVLRPLWTRVFSGVDVPPSDLERIRTAMRSGTAVLVPCHKSHLDYVLLSWVFFKLLPWLWLLPSLVAKDETWCSCSFS